MTHIQNEFWKLSRKFDSNQEKFAWWNGAEFGTIVGMVVTLHSKAYWWLFSAFCVEFVFAWYYQRQNKKILAEMDKLAEGSK